MPSHHQWILLMGLIFSVNPGCSGQSNPSFADRKPAAAGRFYPSDPDELRTLLASLFAKGKPGGEPHALAIVCPHAGYVFSGSVAASGFNQVDPGRQYDNVFVIGSSHYVSFPGASVYNKGDYLTPLGKVIVNRELADSLIRQDAVFTFNPEADLNEHCIEVQIPFLQYYLKKSFRLVPIVLGTQSAETCKKIACVLKPYMNEKNLFVFSSDFAHYPSRADAQVTDKTTCDAILKNSPQDLTNLLDRYKHNDIPNLATNLCGWTSVLTMLNMTTGNKNLRIVPVQYMNSGDTKYGDKKQVVGYWSLAVIPASAQTEIESKFILSTGEKSALLKIARITIEKYIGERRIPDIDTSAFSKQLKMQAGAFVTLKEHGELRGCIGRFTASVPLYKVIQEMAIAAATEDNRFEPVRPEETGLLEIEISVLSPMHPISSPDEIVLGKHGIYIRKGSLSGTFLPQVATETGWTKEEFLGHCSRDKAGIGWDGWKSAELFTYEAFVFSEKEVSGHR